MLRPLCRTLLLSAALLSLWPAAAGATPRSLRSRPAIAAGWLAPGWKSLVVWWVALEGGCGIDPSGIFRQATQPEGTDGGCGIDPDGRCRQATPPEGTGGGCGLDPNGCSGQ